MPEGVLAVYSQEVSSNVWGRGKHPLEGVDKTLIVTRQTAASLRMQVTYQSAAEVVRPWSM